MPLPKEIIALATLGTETGAVAVPQMEGALGEVLRRMSDSGPEAQLLATAAGIKLREQAGYVPGVIDKPIPEPCEPESLPPCSPQAMRHLMVMLEGHFAQCVPEWLRELAQSNYRVPEEALPLLLETGRKHPELRDLIVPVLGKRGEWLANEVTNRDWNWFSVRNIDSRWSRGKDETHIELIEVLRKYDPAHARERVMDGWDADDYKTRAKFVQAFDHGLTMDDETFLEACLDDTRKDVREPAQILLRRLPESRLVQRMVERATPLLKLAKAGLLRKPAIEVSYPTELTAEMRRDGVMPWEKGAHFEEGAFYLYQILVAIRPTFWCEQWKISGDELYAAVLNSAESDLLLQALADACNVTCDTAFGEVLLNYRLEHFRSFNLAGIAHLISVDVREVIALKWLQKYSDGLKNIQIVAPLLNDYDVTWSDELSRAFLTNLNRYLSKGKVRPPRELYGILQNAAAHMSPSLKGEIMRVLETETSAEKMWADLIDEIRLLLDFRQEILTAIHSEGD